MAVRATRAPVKRASIQATAYTAAGLARIRSRLVERDQLMAKFINEFCPKGPRAWISNQSQRMDHPHYWVHNLPSFEKGLEVLDKAAMAISTSHLSIKFQDENLKKQSILLYVESLRRMQVAIKDRRLWYDDRLLAALMCLTLYEVCLS
jgi:hypothetical protein